MLPSNLVTNELKNALGTEVEFERISTSGRSVEFAQKGEAPNNPHRASIAHEEKGEGVSRRRRSVFRVSKAVNGTADPTRKAIHLAYVVVDIPVGNVEDFSFAKDVMAELIAGLASTGADTVVKFDCSGTFAAALINGTC